MGFRHVAIACLVPAAMGVVALPAHGQAAKTSPAFERAILGELDAPTRAEVQKRATRGNTVSGVIATILLNNYQKVGPGKPGAAVSVVAVDFVRGVAVVRRGPNQFQPINFDPKTLRVAK